MAQHFFEGSALVKIYRREDYSEALRNIFSDKENEIYISNITPVEMAEILGVLKKDNVISDEEVRHQIRLLGDDIANRLFMVPYYDEHMDLSAAPPARKAWKF